MAGKEAGKATQEAETTQGRLKAPEPLLPCVPS